MRKLWISKKMWSSLEQRITDLEKKIQEQQNFDPEESKKLLTDCLRRFQSEATRDNAPESS